MPESCRRQSPIARRKISQFAIFRGLWLGRNMAHSARRGGSATARSDSEGGRLEAASPEPAAARQDEDGGGRPFGRPAGREQRKAGCGTRGAKWGQARSLTQKMGAYFRCLLCNFSFVFALFTLNSVSLMYNSGTELILRNQFNMSKYALKFAKLIKRNETLVSLLFNL